MKKNKKNDRASSLVVSMVILGVILIISLSAAMLAMTERRASMGSAKSGLVVQNAQSGLEQVMHEINNGGYIWPKDISVSGSTCNPSTGLIEENTGKFSILLEDNAGDIINCYDNLTNKIADIAGIKSVGGGSDNQRAIKITPECYGKSIDDGLVGWWKFDGNLDDTSANNNDAVNCDTSTYQAILHPIPNQVNANSTPVFPIEGSRTFVRFNEGSNNRNCAVISDNNSYHLQEGSVSFWMRFRGNPFFDNNSRPIFAKDANDCDLDTNKNDTSADTVNAVCDNGTLSNNPICDCGHLGFRFNSLLNPGSFGVRFQSDGNGSHYRLTNNFPVDWNNVWHRIVLTFDTEKYTLYIDGKVNHTFYKADELSLGGDGSFNSEALFNNAWRIWLGMDYPDGPWQVSEYAAYRARWEANDIDMDDLRIYDKALSECEIKNLCSAI